MGCITARVSSATGACITASVSRVGEGMTANVECVVGSLSVSADDVAEHLNVRCSMVCSLSRVTNWLRVSPNEVQWITDDIGVFFDVEASGDWIVVTS